MELRKIAYRDGRHEFQIDYPGCGCCGDSFSFTYTETDDALERKKQVIEEFEQHLIDQNKLLQELKNSL